MRNKLILMALSALFVLSCKKEKITNANHHYPDHIAPLLQAKCATSGCHNAESYENAAGLNLETWEDLFKGARGGSPVIPFAPEYSYLLYTLNTDPDLGQTLSPTMPLGRTTLTSDEYYAVWHWIDGGCPNEDGELPFPKDPNRRKYYVGHSECDEVAVFDAASRQVMGMVEVGNAPIVEYVLDIEVAPDGKDWFAVFFSTNRHIERYSTLTDEKVADIDMQEFGWTAIAFSPDSKLAFVSNEIYEQLAVVDLTTNAMVGPPTDYDRRIGGPVVHPSRSQVYVAEQLGDSLVAHDFNAAGTLSNMRKIDLVQGVQPSIPGAMWPLETFFLPDGSEYFVSCSHSNEVRVLDAQTDSLLDVISLPAGPSTMAWSQATGRLFVVCMIDDVSWGGAPQKLGSINVINTSSHQLERTIYAGFQPYGIAVDDENGVLVVANRNSDPTGPTPHHESPCGDRNGYVTLIDLVTLELLPDYKPELLVDPIVVSIK